MAQWPIGALLNCCVRINCQPGPYYSRITPADEAGDFILIALSPVRPGDCDLIDIKIGMNTVRETIARHLTGRTEYLFPGITGVGHYKDTKDVRKIVQEKSSISVTNQDLRRTYKSIGAELDISPIVIDELLSHAREGVDAHYIYASLTKLREASQKIVDCMIKKSEINLIEQLLIAW